MATPNDAKAKAAATYNAAADFFEHPANTFWARFGKGTIDRLGLKAGQQVLDVCCGSGASAIPAAKRVGPRGAVQINSPEDWWAVIMGSGYRGTVEQLAATDREQLREANLTYIREHEVSELEANVVYARARKV